MPAYLVQIDAWSGAVSTPLRLASHDDERLCHLDGQTWWPVIATLPTLRYDFFDGGFDPKAITSPTGSFALSIGAVPNLPALAIHDTRIRIWRGELGAPFSAFTLIFDGRVKEQPVIANGIATINIGADDSWLDRPLLSTYAGTGAAEGSSDMQGQVKPLALGAPRFASATLVDAVDNIYQLSGNGAIQAVETAFDRLSRFGASVGNATTFAALKAASIPAGQWGTSLEGGYVRFGAPAEGIISFHMRGDAVGGWSRLPGAIIARVATIAGGSGKFSPSDITALNSSRPWNLSLLVTAQTTARELIQRIATSVNAVAYVDWLGILRVAALSIASASMTMAADGSTLPPVANVEQLAIAAPYWKVAQGAVVTWQVHGLGDIAFTAALNPRGPYDPAEAYREGDMVTLPNGSQWLFIGTTPAAGSSPADDNPLWFRLSDAITAGNITYEDGTPVEALKPAEPGATVGATPAERDQLAQLETAAAAAQAAIAQAQADIVEITGAIEGDFGPLMDAINDLENEVDAVQSSVTTLQSATSAVQGNVTTLQGQMTSAQGTITALQSSTSSINNSVTTLQGQMTTAQGNITTLQNSVTTHGTNISTLQSSVTSLNTNVGNLQTQASGIISDVNGLDAQITAQGGHISTLQSTQATQGASITTLQTSVSNAAGDIATLKTQVMAGGGNLLVNTDFALDTSGWSFNVSGANGSVGGRNQPSSQWYLPNENTITIQQPNTTATGYADWAQIVEVSASKWFDVSCYVASHRCDTQIYLRFLDANNADLTIGTTGLIAATGGGSNLSSFPIRSFKIQAPSNAVRARFTLRKFGTNSGTTDSWAWFLRPQVAETLSTSATPAAYSPGSARASIVTQATALSSLTTTVSTLSTTVSTQGGTITTLQSSMTTLQGSVSTLQSTVATQGANITTLQTAVTTAQGDLATLQTQVTAGGGNLLVNTDLANGSSVGWTSNTSGQTGLAYSVNGQPVEFQVPGEFSLTIKQNSATSTGYAEWHQIVAVEAGKWYDVSGHYGAHRANVQVYLQWIDASGASNLGAPNTGLLPSALTGNTLAAWPRFGFKTQAPAAAVRARLLLRKWGTFFDADSWAWFLRPQVAETRSTSASPLAYSPGSDRASIAQQAQALSTVQGTLATLSTTVTTQGASITTLQSSMTNAQGSIATLTSSVTAQGLAIDAVEATVSTQATAITTLQGQQASLTTTVSTQDGQISTLQSSLTTAQGSISTLQSTVSTQGASITSLQSSVSTAQGDVATLKTQVSAGGGNLLVNTDLAVDASGWAFGNPGGVTGNTGARVASGDSWMVTGENGLRLEQTNGTTTGFSEWEQFLPIQAGKWYDVSTRVAAHRCQVQVYISWRDESNTTLSSPTSGLVTPLTGGIYLKDWTHIGFKAQAPANTVRARIVLRKFGTLAGASPASSYAWFLRPQIAETLATSATPLGYSPGSARATIESQAAALSTATSSLATLSTTVGTQGGSITTLQSSFTSLNGTVSTLSSTVTAQGASISTLQSASSTQAGQISTLSSTVATQGSSITTLQSSMSTAQGDVATLKTQVTAGGGNLLVNTDLALDTSGWSFGSGNGSVGDRVPSGDPWIVTGENGLRIVLPTTQSAGQGDWTQELALEAGKWYDVSVYVASHRANVQVYLQFINDAGAVLTTPNTGLVGPTGGGLNITDFVRRSFKAQAPAGTVKGKLYLRKFGTLSGSDSYAWWLRPQVAETLSTSATPVAYSVGSSKATIATQATVLNTATSSLATLSTTVSSQGGSITTLQSSMTSATGSISTLQSNVTSLQGSVSTLQSSSTTQAGQISTLSSTVATQGASITSNASAITTLNGSLSTLSTVVTASSNPNLVPNGGFENGLTGWTAGGRNPSAWVQNNWVWGYWAGNSTGYTGAAGSNYCYLDSSTFGVAANNDYTMSFDYDFQGGSGCVCYGEIVWLNSTGGYISQSNTPLGSPKSFDNTGNSRRKGTLTSPTGAARAYARVIFYAPDGVVMNAVNFRHVKVEFGSVATPYSGEATAGQTYQAYTTLNSSFASLSSTVSSQGGSITTLQSTTTTLSGTVSSLSSTVSAQGSSISSLQSVQSTMQGDVATLKTQVRTGGGNLLVNTDAATLAGWSSGNNGSNADFGINLPDGNWHPQSENTFTIHQYDAVSSGYSEFTQYVAVIGGNWYDFSVLYGSHRCQIEMIGQWHDGNGSVISTSTLGAQGPAGGGPLLGNFVPLSFKGQAPVTAARVRFYMRKYGTSSGGDSWAWFLRPQIKETTSTASTPVAYSPGSARAAIESQATAITSLNGSLATLTTRVSTAESSISQNATAISSTNGALATLSSTVAAQGASITQNATALSTLNSQYSSLSSTVSTLGATVSTQQTAISTLDGRTAAFFQVESVTPGGRAQLRVYSFANGGAGVDIIGDLGVSGNGIFGGTINPEALALQRFMKKINGGGSGSPAAGQSLLLYAVDLGQTLANGVYSIEFSGTLQMNVGRQTTSIGNKPSYVNVLADGGVRIVITKGGVTIANEIYTAQEFANTNSISMRAASFSIVKVIDPDNDTVTGNVTVAIYAERGNMDTGTVDNGDYYQRDMSATYSSVTANAKVRWTFI